MRESDTANLTVADADAMRALGRALGEALLAEKGRAIVVTIQGELGAGKTTFVGGVLNGVGIQGPARSPTYTLIEPYEAAGRQFFHLDLYRLANPHEVESLGLRDLLTNDAVLLIEWPERGAGAIPSADLALTLEYLPEAGRSLAATSLGVRGGGLLSQLRQVL